MLDGSVVTIFMMSYLNINLLLHFDFRFKLFMHYSIFNVIRNKALLIYD